MINISNLYFLTAKDNFKERRAFIPKDEHLIELFQNDLKK